jgi:secondary thiamine-phosphate synthase enzyme
MKMIRYINVKSNRKSEFIDITGKVEEELKDTGIKNGICYLYVPHTTAAVTINEGADPSVKTDILNTLERLVPKDANYRHLEGNSDAHVKSSVVGVSLYVPVEDGKLVLGTWQSVYFCEFDGPRHRRVALKAVGD